MIYHITTISEWNACMDKSHYAPAAFEKEGFIHASQLHQVAGVLQRYYANRSDLLLLTIDEQKLTCQLIYEPSANNELYPHLYGELNKNAILEVKGNFSASTLERQS